MASARLFFVQSLHATRQNGGELSSDIDASNKLIDIGCQLEFHRRARGLCGLIMPGVYGHIRVYETCQRLT